MAEDKKNVPFKFAVLKDEFDSAMEEVKHFSIPRLQEDYENTVALLDKCNKQAEKGEGYDLNRCSELSGTEQEREEQMLNINTACAALLKQWNARLVTQTNVSRPSLIEKADNALVSPYDVFVNSTKRESH